VDKFKGALMVGALRLFALLPWRAVQWVGTCIGWLMWKLPNRSRDVARINLSKCFPELSPEELEALVGRSLMDIGKTLTESACAWIWPAQKSINLVREVEGLQVLKDALASGKGVVGITSHLGNWEVLNHFYCSSANRSFSTGHPSSRLWMTCCASSACSWVTALQRPPRKAFSASSRKCAKVARLVFRRIRNLPSQQAYLCRSAGRWR
jgi:lauroyl/myristoyl acyltransferase